MVGNSSSGLAEAPSFKIGTINIGDRQKGRIMADSVIDCDSDYESIQKSFALLYSKGFKEKLMNSQNPYGNGGASLKIKNTLKDILLEDILKKQFYDLKVEDEKL
jgi:GDP/UDP-N,N'-diacetylbacillosamine 2-epimerase (hydrolysing)